MWLDLRRLPVAPLLALLFLPYAANAQAPIEGLWGPNGSVSAMARLADTLYIGGKFSRVAPVTGPACGVDAATGAALEPYPDVRGAMVLTAGDVKAVVGDGSGGWYLGGSFTSVAGQHRNGLAHIDAAGNLRPWNPDVSGTVYALTLSAGLLYAGGDFTSVGGLMRNRIAAIDTTTGVATGWNPDADQAVRAIMPLAGQIFVGGYFTNIGGQSRSRLASLDVSTGNATSWQPDPDGAVFAITGRVLLIPDPITTLYVGGEFTRMGGAFRSCLASFDVTSGTQNTPTAWNPNADNSVFALHVNGLTIFAGGMFTYAGFATRYGLVALNGSGGATSWDPGMSPQAVVHSLAQGGNTLYVGGRFSGAGGEPRKNLAAFALATGLTTPWAPEPHDYVAALGTSGTTVFAGGNFRQIGGVARRNLAAIDLSTGLPTAWDPSPDNTVQALVVSGSTVYAGGSFSNIGGMPQSFIASIGASTGTLNPWYPVFDAPVLALVKSGTRIYMGGEFFTPRPYVIAFDEPWDVPDPIWNPFANGVVRALCVNDATVYAGGDFTSIGSANRSHLAALSATDGFASDWDPMPNASVRSISASGGLVFAGGYFTQIGLDARERIAAIDAATGLATGWDAGPMNGYVLAESRVAGSMFVGGGFTSINGQTRNRVAPLNEATGGLGGWDPNADGEVRALLGVGNRIFIGGNFANIAGMPRWGLAGFDMTMVGVQQVDSSRPIIAIHAVPNPATGATRLRFSMPVAAVGTVVVFDAAGRWVRRLHSGVLHAGQQRLSWDGRDEAGREVASGVYFVQLRAGDLSETRKLVIAR